MPVSFPLIKDLHIMRMRRPNLWLEATVFLLLVLTFVAVLGRETITATRLSIPGVAGSFQAYGYTDRSSGGQSITTFTRSKPLAWQCSLRAGASYIFCGYGLKHAGPSINVSAYDRVHLKLFYRGNPGRLKFTLKNFDRAYSRPGVGDSTMPVSTEFDVHPGINEITLPLEQFTADSWWMAQRKLPPGTQVPDLRHVVALDFVSAGPSRTGEFSARIEALEFEGILVTSTEWYLLIVGIWMMLAAAILVYRFQAVRRSYEAEQREQARAAVALAEARAAAEAASAAKSQFLANMSHELRTPLNAILGYAQLLEREDLAPRQRHAVETIHQSGTHLLTLITDILDLSKIEAGKLEVLPAPLDLHACIDQVVAMMLIRAEEKGLGFVSAVAPDVPARVIGDGKRVRQILLNLLGNAIKFTASGSVRLDVCVAGWGDGQVRLRIEVSDTGPGIPADQIERIFLPFEQAGAARQRGGGTGLGLSITRQLAEAMQGGLTVESTAGEGSRFCVEITCGITVREPDAQKEAPLSVAGVGALVVDDDPASAAMLTDYLEARGFLVAVAGDGLAALDAARLAWPRLILMDLKMPVMGGFDAIRRLKADPMLRDVPVVVISGNVSATAKAEALAAGATQLLEKPIDLDALGACIGRVFAAPTESRPATDDASLIAPPDEVLADLLIHARAGNMRAIRREAEAIAERDPAYAPFARHLAALAAAYQSPKVLRLIEAKRSRSSAE